MCIALTENRSVHGQQRQLYAVFACSWCLVNLDTGGPCHKTLGILGYIFLEANSTAIDIYWDFSSAKFGFGPEPLEGFYLAVAFNQELVLLLGDLQKDVYKKIGPSPVASNAVFIAKRERIFGKRVYTTKAQFCDHGPIHDIEIECDTGGINDPSLAISLDSRAVLQVKRLRWKFRGNQTILVDGLPVEVFWDVHSWFLGMLWTMLFSCFKPVSRLRCCETEGFLILFPQSSSCTKLLMQELDRPGAFWFRVLENKKICVNFESI
ncbi:uncharacterized protein [Coffea arabica]|uniref:Uncharacterized protein n=1 Tax=Coffea arabica TaxID=13443 RepID=A0ABM4UQL2_COFAR